MIKLTATNDSLANKNHQRCLPENNQKEETPKGTFADHDIKLTTTASRLAIENNNTEQSCDMILFILAEEGLLPGDAHPENLARATVKVECEVEPKDPYDHRRRFIFERYLEDRRSGWLWIKERLQALRMHQRLHNEVLCPHRPPMNPYMRRIKSMGYRGFIQIQYFD
ncbi:hypothetical protein BSL78_13710 [Apostichopus japonicus]|uniref:Uncharacterized protein n=1 Tax=Stichopus japonicus TaxID=307972 RepID=A0A2G8KN81_STIJA|nr:hypothetical protein BSL78_13710 [Apostichopus japonicus]